MKNPRSIGWIAGTVVVMLAISAATYFLLYLPRADDAAAKLDEAQNVRSTNDILSVQITQLAAEFEHLDEYRTELAALAVQIPPVRDGDTIFEIVGQMAVAAGIPLPVLEVSVSDATPLTIFADPGAAQPAPADPTTADSAVDQAEETADDAEEAADAQDETQDQATDTPAPTGPAAVEGLTLVPFSVKVSGPHANVMAFLNSLQVHDGRLFFIGDFDIVRLAAADATDLRPAVADGDLELTVRGTAFSLLPTASTPPAGEGEEGEDVPPTMPTSGGNPFVPLEPTR